MRPTTWLCALAIGLAPCVGAASSHVVVLSVDGLGASELFGEPSCMAHAPTLRRLASEGAYSHGVRGVLPTVTYPSHATLATGTLPDRHGVQDNGRGGEWFKRRSDIAGDTLWDAARRAGRSVAIVTWPSTYGAEADWLVPEDLANNAVATADIRAGSTPGLFDALVEAVGPPALMPFSHREAGMPLDEMTARFAAEIVRRHRPALLLAHFLDYDHRMHADPWSTEACRALARIDQRIADVIEAYRVAGILDRTTVFVVSDHGFAAIRTRVNPFTLLRDAGWARLFPGQEVERAYRVNFVGGGVAFHAASPGAGDARKLAELRARFEERNGGVVRWVSREGARAMGGFPDAAFVLCARPGYAFTSKQGGPGSGGSHGHCPDEPAMNAVFIASGDGVRKAGAIRRMSMVDVGPTIAGFLDVVMPKATGRDRARELGIRSSAEPRPAR